MYDRDFDYDYFGFKVGVQYYVELASASWTPTLPISSPLMPPIRPSTPLQTLERSYLLRVNGKVVERPQHMLMRVAVGIHMEDVDSGG